MVQCIHLMSRYIHNNPSYINGREEFWAILGMAVRSCQSLGMYKDGTHWSLDDHQTEGKRKVFWEVGVARRGSNIQLIYRFMRRTQSSRSPAEDREVRKEHQDRAWG